MINLKRHLKTPNLFDVPKDRPTQKERLEAFVKQHRIFTYGNKAHGWDAMLIEQARQFLAEYRGKTEGHPIEMISGYCRLLEEANMLVTGKTEREAIEELCRLNKIPFNP